MVEDLMKQTKDYKMKGLQDYQTLSNELKASNDEKAKIKKDSESHVADFLKEKKTI